jgi:3-oxoacyl-[acyl-carrier-protein] synthase-3
MSAGLLARPFAAITGLGAAVPPRIVDNAWYAERLDTSDQWIVERTGIRERRIADPSHTVAELSREAAAIAMSRAGITAAQLDSIVLGTATPDRLLPSTACDLQVLLGADNAAAFDISAACPGFVYALTVAEGLIASGQSRTSLVLGAEKLSAIVDSEDRSTAILFGDGAGAAVVERVDGAGPEPRGILSTFLKSDGRLANLLFRPGGGASDPISEKVVAERSHFMKMSGREVFKAAVLAMADATDQAMRRAGVTADDIDLLVPHQANVRIIEATARHAGMPMSKVMVNVDKFGNTSSASIPIALDQAMREGRIGPGSLVLIVAFGAGFTWGSAVIRW